MSLLLLESWLLLLLLLWPLLLSIEGWLLLLLLPWRLLEGRLLLLPLRLLLSLLLTIEGWLLLSQATARARPPGLVAGAGPRPVHSLTPGVLSSRDLVVIVIVTVRAVP